MNYTPNPIRGCGRKKRGGFHLKAGLSPFGRLNAVTYCLGSGVETGENLVVDISARGVWLGDLAASLVSGQFINIHDSWTAPADQTDWYTQMLRKVGKPVLFDHVGKAHYSPASFVNELLAYGPSRRVPGPVAEQIAGLTPIAILFCHDDMPLFIGAAQRDELLSLLDTDDLIDRQLAPTWRHPDWGLGIDNDDGRDHYLVDVIQAMDEDTACPCVGRWAVPVFLKDVPKARQPFAMSWITHVSYVAQKEEETGETLGEVTERMRQKNIQVLVLSDDVEPTLTDGGEVTELF
ncbi:MAG: hypothetical protein HND44_00895 [Chloroflexi bacterium]|nr:hypothetical protein [Ardenticatenaceae bacterium]MBL1127057.1 hypothetical protein [Chloroflexota bacterium]NOG33118.1 hypothetical protein [Chloroflexota bacterium]GIK54583.1 MAG: hypothetical protein BroJett015_02460 [Chloroflexota bacterium]